MMQKSNPVGLKNGLSSTLKYQKSIRQISEFKNRSCSLKSLITLKHFESQHSFISTLVLLSAYKAWR